MTLIRNRAHNSRSPSLASALCFLFVLIFPGRWTWADGQGGQDRLTRVAGAEFFERRVRPLLVEHCYACHSEKEGERQGDLLLDRRAGWLAGGSSGKAVVPGNVAGSLLIQAVRYGDEDLQMPPDGKLEPAQIQVLEQWVSLGAPGPQADLGETEFSRLGDQDYLFQEAESHWAFQPVQAKDPPANDVRRWKDHPIDRWLIAARRQAAASPATRVPLVPLATAPSADPRTLARRLHFDLTGLPPTFEQVAAFRASASAPGGERDDAVSALVDSLLESEAFGEHFARLWLDVARYADTDSFYRPDTRTPHYFPFAFTFRNYVIASFNADTPIDQFIREQLAADLLGYPKDDPRLAALGFLTAGPHANRSQAEALDDWIDVTTRGLMGLTAACARCHDHKFEPIPTADYYSLHGVFASVVRVHPLDEKRQPLLAGYQASPAEAADYQRKRKAIDAKIDKAGNSKAKGNNRSVAKKIRETELAKLLLFHPGAPVRTMVVRERPNPVEPYIHIRGMPGNRGDRVPRRFLSLLAPQQTPFPSDQSGRLELANHIASADNPLTARVFVNRIWGALMGSHLVATPSDFGLQGAQPTHPELLDWLTADFVAHDWSLKHLVRTIVASQAYQQASRLGEPSGWSAVDPTNKHYWRANRKRLSIEVIRDSALSATRGLEPGERSRPEPLWGPQHTKRRAIYGYINRFNLDPTLRVFDFPTPMQSQPARNESIVPTQALFTMNSSFVVEQAVAATKLPPFQSAEDDAQRATALFQLLVQRTPQSNEVARVERFVEQQQRFFPDPKRKQPTKLESPWPLVAQAIMMSNEFQYLD